MEIIHIVLGKANPDRMNGVNKVVYQLATKQVEFGIKVSLWGIAKDKEINYCKRNFETRLFIKKINPFSIPEELKVAIIEKKENAFFHIHGGWVPIFSSIGRLIKKNNLSLIFTPHGSYNTIAMNKSFWLKRLYFKFFENSLLQNATKIHCIGKSEILALRKLHKNNKTILLPYGFENNSEVTIENSKNEDIIFGFIGRLDIYTKGLDTLITAFRKLIIIHPNAQLWIVGNSKEMGKLNKMIIRNNLEKNVTLLGEKFGMDKENILKQIDVFVHPSRNEGLPTSVIEAASYGKPCIVTDATNVGELINEYKSGETIWNQDSEQLCDSMTKLIIKWTNKNEFNKIRYNAIKMVSENFNWGKLIKEFNLKLYKA